MEKEYSIDVSRRKYEMSWVEFQVSKTEANCGDRVSLNYKIKNIGKDDEPGLYVEVINQNLGIEYKSPTFSLINDASRDSIYSDTIDFTIPQNSAEREAVLQATLYMRNSMEKLSPTRSITITCQQPPKPAEEKKEEPPKNELEENNLESDTTTQEEPILEEDITQEENKTAAVNQQTIEDEALLKKEKLQMFIISMMIIVLVVGGGTFFAIRKVIEDARNKFHASRG